MVLLLLAACGSLVERAPGDELSSAHLIDSIAIVDQIEEPVAESLFDYSLDSGWVEVDRLDSTILIEMRYATDDNFVSERLYSCSRCLLRPMAAAALLQAQRILTSQGYRLKLWDCYRPSGFQEALWRKMPDARYVTPPARGSMHSRGLAIDVTLADSVGNELDMGTGFDYFGERAYRDYTDLSSEILYRRKLLRETMHEVGFGSIRTEWWHYSYRMADAAISDYRWPCPSADE